MLSSLRPNPNPNITPDKGIVASMLNMIEVQNVEWSTMFAV